MEAFLKQVTDYVLLKFGLSGVVACLLLILLGLLVLEITKTMLGSERVKHWFLRLLRIEKEQIDLTNYQAFARLDNIIRFNIPNLRIRCALRHRLFTKIASLRIQTLRDALRTMIKADVNDLSMEDLRELISTTLLTASSDWTLQCLGADVPKVAIDKFKSKHSAIFQISERMVLDMCVSEHYYDNNIERVAGILDFISSVEFYVCVLALEQTINELNGEVSGLTFEGMCCTRCMDTCPYMKKS